MSENKYKKHEGWTDEELLEMIDEIGIALAVIEQIPAYTLARNALIMALQSYVNVAAFRGIRGHNHPDPEELLGRLHQKQK